jgi:DNA-directed RNA polymerase subunit RPC12/RpoP
MTESYVACKRCGSPVRISNAQELPLTRCPSCGGQFVPQLKSPSPNFSMKETSVPSDPLEVRKISFFCAQSGGEFSVTFARNTPNEKFRIRSIDVVPSKTDKLPGLSDVAARKPTKTTPFQANDFDIAGWRCPYCSHGVTLVSSLFAKCSKCNRLVCGSKIITIANGPETFQCTTDCGGGGVLSGQIDEFQGQGTIPDRPKSPTRGIADGREEL